MGDIPSTGQSPSHSVATISILAAVSLTIAVYFSGLTGGFVFDDYANILQNADLRLDTLTVPGLLEAAWSGIAGPLKRPIPMISFAVNFATTGEFAGGFKITNLFIHLINGLLVYGLLVLILKAHCRQTDVRDIRIPFIAVTAAALWLVHPINLTSVLYIVQRMNSMAALFSLAAVIVYCVGRERLVSGDRRGWIYLILGAPLLTILGMLSKENAALTIPLIALVEICFYRFATAKAGDRKTLIVLYLVFFVIPVCVLILVLVVNSDAVSARFAGRPFTLGERLLTESRAVWFYVALIFVPRLNAFGIYHDDFPISTTFIEPLSTAFAVTGLAGAVIASVLCVRRMPMVTFGIGWFLIGHSLESTIVPLELVHEHRNYLPLVGLLGALSYAFAVALHGTSLKRMRVFIAVSCIGLCAIVTAIRAGDWSDPITLAMIEAERHPSSFRAVYELGRIHFGIYKLTREEAHYDMALRNLERSGGLELSAKRPYAALMKLAYSRGDTPGDGWKKELNRRYRETLFHPSETLDLHELVKCRAERTCSYPANDILELYQSALSNPTIPDYSKAQLLVDLAVLYVNESSDFEAAMVSLDDAVELFPDEFGFATVRNRIYVLAGRFEAAQQQITKMREISVWRDVLRSPTDEIDQLQYDLDAARLDTGAEVTTDE